MEDVRASGVRQTPIPDRIGGHRVLRRLGEGARSRVFLAAAGAQQAVALKLHAPSVSLAEIMDEAAVLSGLRSRHAVRLLDLDSTVEGNPVLILQALRGGALADLIAARGALRPEEIVTTIAPLAELLADQHNHGFVHGAVTAAHIVFDVDGAPVLVGWGSARSVDTGDARSRMAEDVRALGTIAARLLEPSGEVLPVSEPELAEWLHRRYRAGAVALTAARSPLQPAGPGGGGSPSTGLPAIDTGGLSAGSSDVVSAAGPGPLTQPRAPAPDGFMATWFDLAGLPQRLLESLDRHRGRALGAGLLARAKARWAPVARKLSTVGRGYRIVGGAGAAAIIVAVALALGSASGGTTVVEEGTRGTLDGGTAIGADGKPVSREVEPSASAGDDPASALRSLLAQREQCLRDASIACLAAVVQEGSVAEQEDAAALVSGDTRALPLVPTPADAEIGVVDRLGDGALLRVTAPQTHPTSVLLIRTEAGWRIRMMMTG